MTGSADGAARRRRSARAGAPVGNVEFLARTADTPRFTFGIIEIAPGRVLEAHVHEGEDDAFYIHALAGFDRRIGLPG